jgi:hypothetical protein
MVGEFTLSIAARSLTAKRSPSTIAFHISVTLFTKVRTYGKVCEIKNKQVTIILVCKFFKEGINIA